MMDQTEMEPPTIAREGRLWVTVPNGTNLVGFLGTIPERGEGGASGLVMAKDSHENRIRALDAYAISTEPLRMAEKAGVEFILIHETDTGHVYEWAAAGWYHGDEVPDQFLHDDRDPQIMRKRTSARAIWKEYGGDLYREGERYGGEAAAEMDAGFETAADLRESEEGEETEASEGGTARDRAAPAFVCAGCKRAVVSRGLCVDCCPGDSGEPLSHPDEEDHVAVQATEAGDPEEFGDPVTAAVEGRIDPEMLEGEDRLEYAMRVQDTEAEGGRV